VLNENDLFLLTCLSLAVSARSTQPSARLTSAPEMTASLAYSGYFQKHAYGIGSANFRAVVLRATYQPRGAMIATATLLISLYGVFRYTERTWWLWGTG
jgi:glycerol uptake facilitator-like aquaporin